MIATLHGEYATGVGEFPFFYVFDPRTIDADRQIVFLLTGDCTGMTADALAVVDNKAVIHAKNIIL